MKKGFLLLLCLMTALLLAACSQKPAEPTIIADPTEAPITETVEESPDPGTNG